MAPICIPPMLNCDTDMHAANVESENVESPEGQRHRSPSLKLGSVESENVESPEGQRHRSPSLKLRNCLVACSLCKSQILHTLTKHGQPMLIRKKKYTLVWMIGGVAMSQVGMIRSQTNAYGVRHAICESPRCEWACGGWVSES